jgi:acetyltransferase-like isoleucine patch superfamily enzyme
MNNLVGNVVAARWEDWQFTASITNRTARGKKFKEFGDGSLIAFPWVTIYNEHYIEIGANTMLGPFCALSAGMMPGQECVTSPVVRIGDRCLIGRGSGIVGHLAIEIGNDVWTGHHVYITDQNHGYQDVTRPISQQTQPEEPVQIGDGSWLGTGTVVLPGAQIGRHVAVGANSVVTGKLPDYCVAVGAPARVIRQYSPESGWTPAQEFSDKPTRRKHYTDKSMGGEQLGMRLSPAKVAMRSDRGKPS